ncbi:MAG: hypothetical protein NUV77_23120 [Thermoguttaceae bacterium]|jgi:hypothetical protein|nr:hypothetical protein [Thermoguttaceae bacterium]
MHTVELLDEAIRLAQGLGYRLRQESLGGVGGACEIRGQKWLFLDLDAGPQEQLDCVLAALAREPSLGAGKVSSRLARAISCAASRSAPVARPMVVPPQTGAAPHPI